MFIWKVLPRLLGRLKEYMVWDLQNWVSLSPKKKKEKEGERKENPF